MISFWFDKSGPDRYNAPHYRKGGRTGATNRLVSGFFGSDVVITHTNVIEQPQTGADVVRLTFNQ